MSYILRYQNCLLESLRIQFRALLSLWNTFQGKKMYWFQVHLSHFLPMWLLAIISLGRWGTSTFLAFPDLPRPRTVTRFNLVTGAIFWYFWRGMIWPQLTVQRKDWTEVLFILLLIRTDIIYTLLKHGLAFHFYVMAKPQFVYSHICRISAMT